MGAKAPDFTPGDMLPGTKYRIVREIGAGGMGVVYQVVKPPEIMGVLKLMSSELTAHEEFRTRFFDEVRVLAQLDHPNIVRVFDYDSLSDGTPYYVMELLHGRTVRDVLATMGTIPPRVAFEITRQLCEALHAAHTHDIPVVHRDIKPENIFLHAPRHGEPVVKLIDFGVVAVGDRQHDGQFVGTWKYASPEQIRGERGTPATDIYAIGLVLYEMLCGIGPFEDQETGSLVSQAHMHAKPPPVSKFAPWVPPSIVALVDAALAKNPRQRPRDAHAFAERLYELEWANDGKNPEDRTAEGPLSRILSTAGGAKLASKQMAGPPPRDRLGDGPVIGIPAATRRDGPTLPGLGQKPHEPTSPDEDALLDGLLGHLQSEPLAMRSPPSFRDEGRSPLAGTPLLPQVVNRNSNAPDDVATSDTLPGDPMASVAATTTEGTGERTTRKIAGPPARSAKNDTDTFSSQESDTERAPKPKNGRVVALAAVLLVGLAGVGTLAAYRGHGGQAATSGAAPGADPEKAIGLTGAEMPTGAPGASVVPSASVAPAPAVPSAKPTASSTRKKGARPEAPALPPGGAKSAPHVTPAGKPGDQSFEHEFH